MVERRKVSAAYAAFDAELRRLRRMDDTNQERYFPGPGRPRRGRLSASQMHLLTEAIFARAFSKYEEFIEQTFLLYCQGRSGLSGTTVKSYISPKNISHAKSIIKSGMTFLEWNSPEKIISRCDIYLHPDSPVYLAVTTHQSRLQNIRRIRNAIAHSSDEARTQFRKAVRDELGVAPLIAPAVGEFLIMNDRMAARRQYYLRSYLDVLGTVAKIAAA